MRVHPTRNRWYPSWYIKVRIHYPRVTQKKRVFYVVVFQSLISVPFLSVNKECYLIIIRSGG